MRLNLKACPGPGVGEAASARRHPDPFEPGARIPLQTAGRPGGLGRGNGEPSRGTRATCRVCVSTPLSSEPFAGRPCARAGPPGRRGGRPPPPQPPPPPGPPPPSHPKVARRARGAARAASSLPIGCERREGGHVGARPASFGAAILAESLGGERLGARKEARFRGWDGEEGRGRAGERAPASEEAAAGDEDEAAGVRPPTGAPPPFPHPPQLSSSGPGRGGGTWSGAGRGSRPEWVRGAAQRRAHAAPGKFVAAPQVWGPAEVCMWGARASRRAAAALPGPRWSRPEEASPAGDRQARGGGAGAARRGVALRSARRCRPRGDLPPPPPPASGGCGSERPVPIPIPVAGGASARRCRGRGGLPSRRSVPVGAGAALEEDWGADVGPRSAGGGVAPQVKARRAARPRGGSRLCLSLGKLCPGGLGRCGPEFFRCEMWGGPRGEGGSARFTTILFSSLVLFLVRFLFSRCVPAS